MSITWSNINKSASTVWSNIGNSLNNTSLLKEDGFYILLENGGRIILEQSIPTSMTWTNQIKN